MDPSILSFPDDRNAENFKFYFADQGKKVWTQEKGGAFKTPHIMVTPGHGAGPEARVSSGSCALSANLGTETSGKGGDCIRKDRSSQCDPT